MVIPWPELVAAAAFLLAGAAEVFHLRRVAALGALAWGPGLAPRAGVAAAPVVRVLAVTALAWGLATLWTVPPRVFQAEQVDPAEVRHIVLILDVSPSMKLTDAGPQKNRTRSQRALELMESLFDRVPMEQVRVSVVATYNGAKPVVVDTKDIAVVRNILDGLPLSHAFPSGETRLLDGLAEAVRLAKPWVRGSTTFLMVTDGDSVPPTGVPDFPPSVRQTIFVGVGDARVGQFINGRNSRQDASTLGQLAQRTRGAYHDGNERNLPTDLLRQITAREAEGVLERLTRREYALLAIAVGSFSVTLLPLMLTVAGLRVRQVAGVRRPAPVAFGASDIA